MLCIHIGKKQLIMKIKIIKNKNISNFNSWPIWQCEPSTFDWIYEEEEHCFIIQGSVTVSESRGSSIKIQSGDYVIFSKGLKCTWDVHDAIKKHYIFK